MNLVAVFAVLSFLNIIKFSLRPDEAMLFWHGESLSVLINIFCSVQFTRSSVIYIGCQAE